MSLSSLCSHFVAILSPLCHHLDATFVTLLYSIIVTVHTMPLCRHFVDTLSSLSSLCRHCRHFVVTVDTVLPLCCHFVATLSPLCRHLLQCTFQNFIIFHKRSGGCEASAWLCCSRARIRMVTGPGLQLWSGLLQLRSGHLQ